MNETSECIDSCSFLNLLLEEFKKKPQNTLAEYVVKCQERGFLKISKAYMNEDGDITEVEENPEIVC